MTDFNQLTLPTQLQNAIRKLNFTTPTPIQAQAIPVALEGKDLIGCAQTGTGKTAAFAIPLVARLAVEHGKDGLILAPTRELAMQITEVLRKLVEHLPRLRPAIIIGGGGMHQQAQALRRHPRIIVATPGRLIDHLGQKNVSLDHIGLLVLDEADQMLDMGFAPQLNQILKHLPPDRQTLMFSATLPEKILDLAKRFLKDPARISVGPTSRPVDKIRQSVVRTTAAQKNDLLLGQLNARKGSALVFLRTKHRTEKLHKYLTEYGFSVARIHGGRSQAQRNQALQGFRNGSIRILVATDIAARGLDIPHIEHVINFDLPMVPEDYVHRIGRTARAGRVGESLAILLPEDEDQWRRINRLINPNAQPNAQKGKTFSRPPVGPNSRSNSRRFDRPEQREQRSMHAKGGPTPFEDGGHRRPRRKPVAGPNRPGESRRARRSNESSEPNERGRFSRKDRGF